MNQHSQIFSGNSKQCACPSGIACVHSACSNCIKPDGCLNTKFKNLIDILNSGLQHKSHTQTKIQLFWRSSSVISGLIGFFQSHSFKIPVFMQDIFISIFDTKPDLTGGRGNKPFPVVVRPSATRQRCFPTIPEIKILQRRQTIATLEGPGSSEGVGMGVM